ncbi:MAG: TolC family protein [Rickettsiales bacterium]|jgi:outer membrane protein|nr:TolC family protein [Rickettsiales bacterium]
MKHILKSILFVSLLFFFVSNVEAVAIKKNVKTNIKIEKEKRAKKKKKKIIQKKDNGIIIYNKNVVSGMTLDEVLRIALENNPKVKQQFLNVDVAEANYGAGKSIYLPTINGNFGYNMGSKNFPNAALNLKKIDTGSWNAGVGLSYLLYDFGGRGADVDALENYLQASQYNLNTYVQEFIYNVIDAYYKTLSAIANEIAAVESEKSSLEAFNAAKTRYRVGLVALTDKLQAETSYNQSILTLENARNQTNLTKANLNYLLNLSPQNDVQLSLPDMDAKDMDLPEIIEELVVVAINNRNDLKSLQKQQEAKENEVYKNSVANRLPSIKLTGDYTIYNDLKSDIQSYNGYSIGIGASVPFYTGGLITNQAARSKAELQIVKEQVEDLKKNIELDVWNAEQNYKTAKKNFKTNIVILKSAKETEKNIFGRYKNGKSSMLDLLNAQSGLANAKYTYINAQYDLFIKKANLIRALGSVEFTDNKGEENEK